MSYSCLGNVSHPQDISNYAVYVYTSEVPCHRSRTIKQVNDCRSFRSFGWLEDRSGGERRCLLMYFIGLLLNQVKDFIEHRNASDNFFMIDMRGIYQINGSVKALRYVCPRIEID